MGKSFSDGKTVDGGGRLTNIIVDSTQTYYSKAIKCKIDNPQAIQDAFRLFMTMKFLVHLKKLLLHTKHRFYLSVSSSWCKY